MTNPRFWQSVSLANYGIAIGLAVNAAFNSDERSRVAYVVFALLFAMLGLIFRELSKGLTR